MNIFEDPDVDLQKVIDTICESYVLGPDGSNATDEELEALAIWAQERYLCAQILDMAFSGVLTIAMDPETKIPTFHNTPEGLAALKDKEKAEARPKLSVVK